LPRARKGRLISLCSQKVHEVIDAKVGLAQDGARRSPVEFLVFRDDELGEGIVAT
jgi:hypothetical protein